jgi:TetR/AcrR family transcriptional regulator, transcriptional repressor of bet genes
MPRKVDHEARRREIIEAVIRITLKGGLSAATFREVAAEAGVSVRLVQYYFGGKDELLLRTQQFVAMRSVERLRAWIRASDGSPRAWLRAFMGSFIPVDDESRAAMIMYVALFVEWQLDPTTARDEARNVPRQMQRVIGEQLDRAKLRAGVDRDREAMLLSTIVPSLGQGVLDGTLRSDQAFDLIDYALDRALRR